MGFTLGLCLAEANGWVLLFWRSLSFESLGNFLISFRRLGLRGCGFVLGERLLHRDTLVGCFEFGFFELDGIVMYKMLYIFGVVISRRFLCFWRTMVFF